MITVKARVHGHLLGYLPGGRDLVEMSLPPGSTASELARKLGLPGTEIWMVSVNGTVSDPHRELANGDQVDFFAPEAGGS